MAWLWGYFTAGHRKLTAGSDAVKWHDFVPCFDRPRTEAYRYFRSGSNLSINSIDFSYLLHTGLATTRAIPQDRNDLTYIVNTIPPLTTKRASLGTAPDQKVKMPSFLKMDAAQAKLFL